MKVSEIFYSLQGEGSRQGEPSLFVRLSGCSAKYACYASGVRCDTEFESGKDIAPEELQERLDNLSQDCDWIVWTGGEPTDQLSAEVIEYFKGMQYFQAIETSGIAPVPAGLDLVTISPKVAEHVLAKNFDPEVWSGKRELKYVRHAGQGIPAPSLKADYYFLSPHFNGNQINEDNLNHCTQLCLENPSWRLSTQLHKIWKVL
jgi:organic radical activating enzyme